ncbi:Hypothetical predicted protein [Pelobates cultripes]|uniref:Uncharacterized protein n=1 Tax=Pelobates cultripes TaxID=61616 RepID=A0AAD1S7M3_PELCU|nr:Hypothetical predicted protein [Pelobates cultripes]
MHPPGPGTYVGVVAVRLHHSLCGRTAAAREGTDQVYTLRALGSLAVFMACRELWPHAGAALSLTYKSDRAANIKMGGTWSRSPLGSAASRLSVLAEGALDSTTLHIKGPHALSGEGERNRQS